jgi:mRNA-degrading endonuclease YafQ of YafQ-DinJ toxin-antitoxin module
MRIVKYTTRFKRDYRREKSGQHGEKLDNLLMEVVDMLAADTPLLRRNFDQAGKTLIGLFRFAQPPLNSGRDDVSPRERSP